MELSFDIRGNLKPYRKISITLDEFEEIFVKSFDEDSIRHEIFSQYQSYLSDFQQSITKDFTQWIDGSFVTNKKNPRDLDLVNLLDYQIVEENQEALNQNFLSEGSMKKFGLDTYVVRLYPEDHKFHTRTQSDLAYWNHWFGFSKLNRRRKRFSKGFLEIEFKNKK